MLIRPIAVLDIPAIARLHARALPWSINGRMGPAHLEDMYARLLRGDDIVGFTAWQREKLLAFQISTTDWRQARKRMSGMPLWRKLFVALACLLHPADLVVLWETLLRVPPIFRRSGLQAEIVTWVAEPGDVMASLAAHQCLQRSLAELAAGGHERCIGQFQKPNPRPHAYFERLGYESLASFRRNDVFAVACKSGGPAQTAPGGGATQGPGA